MPHSAKRFCTLRAEIRLPSFDRNSASSSRQTARAGQASAQSRRPHCGQSAGGALCCPCPSPTLHRIQIEVFDIEVHQLRQTQPGTVHHLQHRAVAHGQRIVKIDIQQAVYVVDVDIFRQMARRFRRGDPFAGLAFSRPG
jgi:hypothetical protein